MRKDRIGKIEEKIEELTRRVDNIATELHTSDSEYGLHQIPELKKQVDKLTMCFAVNDIDLHIHSYAIQSLQRTIYPIAEAHELQKMKKKIEKIRKKSPKGRQGKVNDINP